MQEKKELAKSATGNVVYIFVYIYHTAQTPRSRSQTNQTVIEECKLPHAEHIHVNEIGVPPPAPAHPSPFRVPAQSPADGAAAAAAHSRRRITTPPPTSACHTYVSQQYHRGFREQVEKWPVHPLDVIIDWLGKYPKARVADFGCGEARLAATVPNKVHAFIYIYRERHVLRPRCPIKVYTPYVMYIERERGTSCGRGAQLRYTCCICRERERHVFAVTVPK